MNGGDCDSTAGCPFSSDDHWSWPSQTTLLFIGVGGELILSFFGEAFCSCRSYCGCWCLFLLAIALAVGASRSTDLEFSSAAHVFLVAGDEAAICTVAILVIFVPGYTYGEEGGC